MLKVLNIVGMSEVFRLDISAPLFWWNEISKYGVRVVERITPDMQEELTIKDFCIEDDDVIEFANLIIDALNQMLVEYNYEKSSKSLRKLNQFLLGSYIQTASVDLTFEEIVELSNVCAKLEMREMKDFLAELRTLVDAIEGSNVSIWD